MNRKQIEELAEYYDTHDTADEMDGGRVVEPLVDPMVVVSLRLPKHVVDQVRALAAERGVRPTALLREWVEAQVARAERGAEAVIGVSELLDFVNRAATVRRR
jgi:predicted DNA-binding protein